MVAGEHGDVLKVGFRHSWGPEGGSGASDLLNFIVTEFTRKLIKSDLNMSFGRAMSTPVSPEQRPTHLQPAFHS